MIHPEAKFFSSYEPMESDKLYASKMQWWNRHRIDTPILKGRNQKGVIGIKQIWKLASQSPFDPKNNLWLHALSFRPTGVALPPMLTMAKALPPSPWAMDLTSVELRRIRFHPQASALAVATCQSLCASLFLKDNTCLQPDSSTDLSCRIWQSFMVV